MQTTIELHAENNSNAKKRKHTMHIILTMNTCSNMDRSQKYEVKQKTADTKDYILYAPFIQRSKTGKSIIMKTNTVVASVAYGKFSR